MNSFNWFFLFAWGLIAALQLVFLIEVRKLQKEVTNRGSFLATNLHAKLNRIATTIDELSFSLHSPKEDDKPVDSGEASGSIVEEEAPVIPMSKCIR